MPNWQNSNRRQRLPSDWRDRRQKRLELDDYKCRWFEHGQLCGRPATEVDHIKAMTDDHRIEALQSLCTYHHAIKSGREGAKARAAKYRAAISKSKKKFRRDEPHPGALR